MTHGTLAIMTLGGADFGLDRSRRDALVTYAKLHADKDGKPVQQWVRETWGFKEYEAKHLLRGNASEVMWERILKHRGRHGGWRVALPIIGAIIGEDVADFYAAERKAVADERARHEAEEARIATLEAHARERRAFAGLGPGSPALRAGRGSVEDRVGASGVGRDARLTAQAGKTGR